MCVVKGFRWLKMCLYIKGPLFLESVAFVYNRVQEHRDIGLDFDSWVMRICLFDETFNVGFTYVA